MMPLETYFSYLIACIALISIPGPNVALTIANSLQYGTRAGIATIVGTGCATALMLAGLIIGMAPCSGIRCGMVLVIEAIWCCLSFMAGRQDDTFKTDTQISARRCLHK